MEEQRLDKLEKLIQDLLYKVDNLTMEVRNVIHGDRISYNLKEAAKITGIDPGSLRLKCKQGKIQYSQDVNGGTIIIHRDDLIRYLNDSNSSPDRYLNEVSKAIKKGLRRRN